MTLAHRRLYFCFRLALVWACTVLGASALANADFYVESPSTPERAKAEAQLANLPELNAGAIPRVIRRFRVGEGWAYVIRVDSLDENDTQRVAELLSVGDDAGVIYRRVGSRTIRVLESQVAESNEPETPIVTSSAPRPDESELVAAMGRDDESNGDEDAAETEAVSTKSRLGRIKARTEPSASVQETESDSIGDEDFEPRLQSSSSIIQRAIRAHGGEGGGVSQVQGAGSVHFRYQRTLMSEPQNMVVDHDYIRWGEGLRLGVEIVEGNGVDSLTVVDRDHEAWVLMDGKVTQRDPERTASVLSGYGPDRILGLSLQIAQQAQSSEQWAQLVLVGSTANPAGEQIVLKAAEGSGRGLKEVTFDSVHTRLVSAKWSTLDGVLQMRFEDYHVSDSGLVYPKGMTVWQDDQMIEQILFQELRLNQPVEKDLFDAPNATSPN